MIRNLRQIDLNLLLVFDALMQERNLTRAADKLHMSQSTMSNALSRLRRQLDEPLFTRTARGMRPSARALALHEPVRQALRLLQSGLGPQEEFDPCAERVFNLAMNDYAQALLLPLLHRRLASLAPRLGLHVQADDAEQLQARLASGELDLAIDYLYFDGAELGYQPLLEERLVVIGRLGHPAFAAGLGLDDYQRARHVSILPRAGRGSPLEIVLGSARVQRQVALHVPHYLTIPPIVAQSELLGTVPQRLAEHFAPLHGLCIAPLPFDMPAVQVSLIWHRLQELEPGLVWLRRQLLELFSD